MEHPDSIKGVLINYGEWLKKSYHYKVGDELVKFKSVAAYIDYMVLAVNDLGMSAKDFQANSKPGLLNVFLSTIKTSTNFKLRTPKEQANIVSAFNIYIIYKNEGTV